MNKRKSEFVSAAVAAAVQREYLDSLTAASARAMIEHVVGLRGAERAHICRAVLNAVFDRRSAD